MKKMINLLVVDDDRFIRRSITRMLGRVEMLKIFEAEDRSTVFEIIRGNTIDCILMDYYMADITALVQTDGSKMADIMAAGGKMLLCAFGSLAATVVVAIISSRIASDFPFQSLLSVIYSTYRI